VPPAAAGLDDTWLKGFVRRLAKTRIRKGCAKGQKRVKVRQKKTEIPRKLTAIKRKRNEVFRPGGAAGAAGCGGAGDVHILATCRRRKSY